MRAENMNRKGFYTLVSLLPSLYRIEDAQTLDRITKEIVAEYDRLVSCVAELEEIARIRKPDELPQTASIQGNLLYDFSVDVEVILKDEIYTGYVSVSKEDKSDIRWFIIVDEDHVKTEIVGWRPLPEVTG